VALWLFQLFAAVRRAAAAPPHPGRYAQARRRGDLQGAAGQRRGLHQARDRPAGRYRADGGGVLHLNGKPCPSSGSRIS
jgi:hypothetical protein